jgi:hypothetical protein
MAFDLVARLKIIDNATAPLRRMQRATEQLQRVINRTQKSTELWRDASGRLRDSMGRFAKETERASWNLTNLGNGLRNVAKEASGIRGLAGAFTGLATAIGGAYTAKKIFDSTVWEAAKFENSQVVIRAMFDDRKAADSYMKMLERFAIDSPVLNSQDMFENSKSFIATSKNLEQLEKMWNLAERLVALDPMQGVSGAVLALKEFFSGDVVSLVERFELPRQELKAIKDLPLDQKLIELDKFFNKLGATNKLVKEMGNTTIGLWNRVREQFAVILREMGRPSLEVLNGFFTKIIQKLESGDFNRFAQIGARMIKSILTGLTNGIMAIYNWFSAITKSEEFQKRTTLWSKVQFIIGNLYDRFLEWLKKDGAKQIASTTSDLITALASALEKNTGPIVTAALTVGSKIGSAMARGIMDAIAKNPIAQWIINGGSIAGIAYDKIRGLLGGGGEKSKKRKSSSTRYYNPRLIKGYYHGLDYVPYDNMIVRVHKGERILTAKENREYSKGGRSVQVSIGQINLHGVGGDMRKAARELMKIMADELEKVGANMARV